MNKTLLSITLGLLVVGCSHTQNVSETDTPSSITVPLFNLTTEGVGDNVGTVTLTDTDQGLQIEPNLTDLAPGEHGFHVHENPSCNISIKDDGTIVAGGAAGGHYDPGKTGEHAGPEGNGHLGDLPLLVVNEGGTTTDQILYAPRPTVADFLNRSLMIHAKGDNFSDIPAKLGGGGSRLACGIIK